MKRKLSLLVLVLLVMALLLSSCSALGKKDGGSSGGNKFTADSDEDEDEDEEEESSKHGKDDSEESSADGPSASESSESSESSEKPAESSSEKPEESSSEKPAESSEASESKPAESSSTSTQEGVTETEYFYIDSETWATLIVVLENKSNKDYSLEGTAHIYDKDGKELDESSNYINALGAGEKTYAYFSFYSENGGIDSYDFEFEYGDIYSYYGPVVRDLKINCWEYDDRFTFEVYNPTDMQAYVSALVIGLDKDGQMVSYNYNSFSYLYSKNTSYAAVYKYSDAEHYEIIYSGYTYQSDPYEIKGAFDNTLETEELFMDYYGYLTVFLTAKNTGTIEYSISCVAVSRTADEAVVGVSTTYLNALAPDEESILIFSFADKDKIKYIDYYFYYGDDPYYHSVGSDLECKLVNGDKLQVEVTNNGTHDVSYPYVYVLFFDSNDQLVDYDWVSAYVNDGKLVAGETVTKELYGPSSFDHVRIYTQAYYY